MIANKDIKNISLEDLGFNDFFATARNQLGTSGFPVARVIAEYQGAYKVKNETGEYLATITGKQMFNASSREDYPAVGDWVVIKPTNKEQAIIQNLLPRKTAIKRSSSGKNETQIIAANVDVAFIIESADRDYSLNRFERLIALAKNANTEPVVILNKTDLISEQQLEIMLQEITTRLSPIRVIATSASSDLGQKELIAYLQKGKTYCLLGSSGVGKSSLINKLLGNNSIKTKAVSEYSGRGTHTTTNREMYFLSTGSIVIDTPGMREIGMTDATDGIASQFDEILALGRNCKFKDCTHTHEPGCAVLLAIKSNNLDRAKYRNYINLKKEAEHYQQSKLEKRQKQRKFGKFIKKAKDDLKRYGK